MAKGSMPTNIFIAYADLYLGKQLCRQFASSLHLFNVYGCTWDEDANELLPHKQPRQSSPSSCWNDACTDALEVALLCNSNRNSGVDVGCDSIPQTHTSAQACGMPVNHTGDDALTDITNNGNNTEVNASLVPLSPASNDAHSPLSLTRCDTSSSIRYFWRGAIDSVRHALHRSDWIILMLKEAQEVFDMLHCVIHGPFERKKRLVLLSNFMTWVATPPLFPREANHDNTTSDGAEDESEAYDEDADAWNAPYPVDDVAKLAVNDQLTDWPDDDADEDDEAHDDGGLHSAVEVLTEDQYNRRVPHIKYYNWRDAEKAVASAHRTHGLPLDTFVLFGGLTYGDGEGALAPFFRGAWSGAVSLPIYGDGEQFVPMIHVCDLATLTRKILSCSLADLPQPSARYIFATDGARLSWRTIMLTIREMFERRRSTPILATPSAIAAAAAAAAAQSHVSPLPNGAASSAAAASAAVVSSAVYSTLEPIPPADEVLHNDVELFTVNLRVENETAMALMEHTDAFWDNNTTHSSAPRHSNDTQHRDSDEHAWMGHDYIRPSGQIWVAPGGLRRNMERVSLEFCSANHLTPLRLVLLGPPRVGKTRLSCQLAKQYKLVRLTMQDIVRGYQLQLRALQEQLTQVHDNAVRAEAHRRLEIKRQRVIRAARRRALQSDVDVEEEEEEDFPSKELWQHAGNDDAGAADNKDNNEEAVQHHQRHSRGGTAAELGGSEADLNIQMTQQSDGGVGGVEHEVQLSSDEMSEVHTFVEDRLERSSAMAAMRRAISEIERVLWMRIRAPELTPEASTKRRMAQPKKKLTKEQQRRKEEEDLLLAKEAIRNAPFQNRALALMTRWRLDLPDCRNQGYILDGLPPSVELARMCFGSEELRAPETEEEALAQPRQPTETERRGAHLHRTSQGEEEGEDAESDIYGAARLSESCDESRLPDYVVVLDMSDSDIVDRLTAVAGGTSDNWPATATDAAVESSSALEQYAEDVTHTTTSASVDSDGSLNQFYEELKRFRDERNTDEYSVFDFFHSAVTAPGLVTAGGRRVKIHSFTASASETTSSASVVSGENRQDSATMDTMTQRVSCVLGEPHTLGKTPGDVLEDEVRVLRAQMVKQQNQLDEEAARREGEMAAFDEESRARTHVDATLRRVKQRDLEELERRKAPLRDYLLKNVIPLLNKGLMDVCTRRPDDPIDHLAEWLLRHNPNSDVIHDL